MIHIYAQVFGIIRLLIVRTLDPFDQTSALQIFQRREHVGFRRLTDFNDLSRIFILNFSFLF